MNKNELVPSLHSLQCGKGQYSCRYIYNFVNVVQN
jgi:hypothetical protein